MEARWAQLLARLGSPPRDAPATLYWCLEALYSHPPRVYHSLAHIDACLDVFDGVRSSAEAPDAVEFALWLHDCVYDPRRQDNEVRSAQVAEMLLGVVQAPSGLAHCVRGLILATRHDGSAATDDERLLADIDLSILGAAAAEYDRYAQQIREEHAFADDAAYGAGRSAFLDGALRRPRIFATDLLRAKLEEAARTNLRRERGALGGL